MKNDIEYKFIRNITLKELKRAVKYAEEYGVSEFKTVSLFKGGHTGIMSSLGVHHNPYTRRPLDITEFEST